VELMELLELPTQAVAVVVQVHILTTLALAALAAQELSLLDTRYKENHGNILCTSR
jgi:hypothetical protein